jgi:hypothetical protein
MTETLPAVQDNGALENLGVMEQVLLVGDLRKLTDDQRCEYYFNLCKSLRLNPWTRPFEYVDFDGKLTLYARKDCAEQLRQIHGISILEIKAQQVGELYVVSATARTRDGREDSDQGVVETGNLRGKFLANAYMRAVTKAKRRVTLSICGLGFPDESELETIPNARTVRVDETTGEILEPPAALPPAPPQPARTERPAAPPKPAPSPAAQARLDYGKLAYRAGQLNIKPPALAAQMTAEEIREQAEMLQGMIAEVEAKQTQEAAA